MSQSPPSTINASGFEPFDTAFKLSGFGPDPEVVGKVASHVAKNAQDKGLHVKSMTLAKGEVAIRGKAEPGKLKGAVDELLAELVKIVEAGPSTATALPRTADEVAS